MTAPAATLRRRRAVAAIVAVLIVAAAALLVVGVLLERHAETVDSRAGVATGEQQEGHHDESVEAAHSDSAPDGAAETVGRLTGFNPEAPWIVALGTVVSIGCAVAVWRRPTRLVIAIVVAFTAAALILDALELHHQIGENHIGLAVLAAGIAALRAAAIAGSGYLYRTPASA
jgi:predicted metal-binding membrane protein